VRVEAVEDRPVGRVRVTLDVSVEIRPNAVPASMKRRSDTSGTAPSRTSVPDAERRGQRVVERQVLLVPVEHRAGASFAKPSIRRRRSAGASSATTDSDRRLAQRGRALDGDDAVLDRVGVGRPSGGIEVDPSAPGRPRRGRHAQVVVERVVLHHHHDDVVEGHRRVGLAGGTARVGSVSGVRAPSAAARASAGRSGDSALARRAAAHLQHRRA